MSFRKRLAVAALIASAVGVAPALAASSGDRPADAIRAGAFVPGHVMVKYAAGLDAASQQALEHANGATRLDSIDALGIDVLSVPEGAEQHVVEALSRSGKVDYAELDGVTEATQTPDDPYWPQQWGPVKVGMPQVWDTTTGSSSVVIAVIDSGADLSHPDLVGRFTAGYDFVNADTDPSDDYGHGTKTTGVLGARSNNGAGIASYCWSCSIMPLKVLSSTGSGSYSALIDAIVWATDHGADVVNMSLVGSTDSTSLQSAVQYAHDRDVVLVGGAGNAGDTTPTYPASYPEVVAVAGSTSSDALYSWSSYGSWVDLAAPGCTTSTVMGGSYGSFCGTSSATPVVAGIVGALRAAAPSAPNTAVESALTGTAVAMSQVHYGRVDAAAALGALGVTTAPDPSTSPSPMPAPTASASPSPTTSATASPAPSPTASPTTPTSTTTTYSGALTRKSPSGSYAVSAAAGTVDATLTFSRASSLTLDLIDPTGAVVAEGAGASPVTLTYAVPSAGSYTLVVSGARSSFALTVTTSS